MGVIGCITGSMLRSDTLQITPEESIGSSARIEGSKLTEREVEKLLSNRAIQSFGIRDN